jgi:hypothetical protein
MEGENAAAGLAALAICESLLLSLTENKLIDGAEALAILGDAAAAHRNAAALGPNGASHEAAADLIDLIVTTGNSVRRA